MSVHYTIDDTRHLVTTTWEGNVPIQEWMALMDRVLADPRFHKGMVYLADRRLVTKSPPVEDVQVAVQYFRAHQEQTGHIYSAILTGPNAADFGVVRMAEVLAGEFLTFGYFDNPEAAEQWLAMKVQP